MKKKNVSLTPERILCGAVWIGLLTGIAVFYLPDPLHNPLLPQCAFFHLTGFYCPGCGSTRAFYALLHGRILEAIDHNVFFVATTPFLLYGLLCLTRKAIWGNPLPFPRLGARIIYGILVFIIAFWILRNIPSYPFNLLAP